MIFNYNEQYLGLKEVSKKGDSYPDSCHSFEINDPITLFVAEFKKNDFLFYLQEISANILYDIAYRVNRYPDRHLIEKLINNSIEPLLEDILKKE